MFDVGIVFPAYGPNEVFLDLESLTKQHASVILTFMRRLSSMFTDTTLWRTDQGHICDTALKLICMPALGHLLN